MGTYKAGELTFFLDEKGTRVNLAGLSQIVQEAVDNVKPIKIEIDQASVDSIKNKAKEIQDCFKVIDPKVAVNGLDKIKLPSGLTETIHSLSEAMREFKGINFDVKIGSNQVSTMAKYGASARQGIKDLKGQAAELERVFSSITNIPDGIEAVLRTAERTIREVPDNNLLNSNVFSIFENLGDNKASLTSQMDTYREYIALMERLARLNGIDISNVTSGFSRSAEQIFQDTEKIKTGEQDLESGFAKLKDIFGSSINADDINSRLEQINNNLQEILHTIEKLSHGETGLNSVVEDTNAMAASIDNLGSASGSVSEVSEAIRDVTQSAAGAESVANSFEHVSDKIADVQHLVFGLNQEGLAGANSLMDGLLGIGVSDSDIDRVVSEFTDLQGRIKDVAVSWKTFGEDGRHVSSVTVNALDEQGNAIKRTINYYAEATESGLKWSAQQSGSAKVMSESARATESAIKEISAQRKELNALLTKNEQFNGLEGYDYESIAAGLREQISALDALDEIIKRDGADNELYSESIKEIKDAVSDYTTVINQNVAAQRESAKAAKESERENKNQEKFVSDSVEEIETFKKQVNSYKETLAEFKDDKDFGYDGFAGSLDRTLGTLDELEAGIKSGAVSVRDYGKTMEWLKAEFNTCSDSVNSNKEAINQRDSAQKKSQDNINKERTALKGLVSMYAEVNSAMAKLEKQKGGTSSDAYGRLSELKSRLGEVLGSAMSEGYDFNDSNLRNSLSDIGVEFQKIKHNIDSATPSVGAFSGKFSEMTKVFAQWFSVSQIVMKAVETMKRMVSESIALDDAMTQLRIVTDATELEYEKFGTSAANTAQRIGASITDLIDSTTVYARLGYDLNESSVMSELTAMLKNVGDIEIGDAQNAITAIVKAYDVNIDQLETVMDKLVVVGNNTPISVAQIAEGMNNASSALKSAGNTFEESVALLTAANTTVNICRAA